MSNAKQRIIASASVLFLLVGVALAAAARAPEKCPPVLAGLMPRGAVNVAGQYTAAGMIAIGGAAADLPFVHPCSNQTTKYPGRISLDVQHYQQAGLELFKMQVEAVEKQTLESERAEMEKRRAAIRKNTSTLDKISEIKTETLAGGTLLYFEYSTDCSEGTKRSKPSVRLLAVAHTDSSKITIQIEGFISAEAARTAALEVLANFAKADFGK